MIVVLTSVIREGGIFYGKQANGTFSVLFHKVHWNGKIQLINEAVCCELICLVIYYYSLQTIAACHIQKMILLYVI